MEWIGETFTSERGWSHLEDLVDVGNRMAGTEGERRAAELTREAFAEAGARDARLEEFAIQGWERGDSTVHGGSDTHDCIALPRSPEGRTEGELVDLGHGLPEDFEGVDLEGAVVLTASDVPDWFDRYVHRREKYYRAVEAGAGAFVYRNHVEGCLPPTGSVGTEADPIGPIPAVGVSSEVGERLSRRQAGSRVGVEVEATIGDATSQNVHATLGPDTDRRVLVTSHVDAHDIAEGAMDNGAGTAMVVELAGALARREDELDTRVEFVAFGAEEVGLVGSAHLAETADLDGIKAVLNNDGVGRGRTLSMTSQRFDALEDATERVADRYDHPIKVAPRMGPHSDHWPFVRQGVPGLHALSKTPGQGRGWGHTYADTLDKLDSRDLREQAVLLTDLAVELADESFAVEHADTDRIAAALEEEDLAEGMRFTGEWPFGD